MNLHEAQKLIGREMREHGLLDAGWVQRWYGRKRTLGTCNYDESALYFSRPFVLVNDWHIVRGVVMHEIAHALCPGHGHDAVWARKCRELGGDAVKRVNLEAKGGNTVPPKWIASCSSCAFTASRHRLTKSMERVSCPRCCPGSFNPAFVLTWRENRGRLSA